MLAYNSVEKWAKTEKAPWNRKFWAMGPKVRKEAKGTVLIIGPYNSPVWSSFVPLVSLVVCLRLRIEANGGERLVPSRLEMQQS